MTEGVVSVFTAPRRVKASGARRTRSLLRRRTETTSLIAAGIFVLMLAVATIVPSALAPYDPLAIDTGNVLAAPSASHLLGTDENGRDILSRVIHGAGRSLPIGLGAVAIAVSGGLVLGLLAGSGVRSLDVIVTRITEIGFAFPEILLAILVIVLFGKDPVFIAFAIGIGGVPGYARVVRNQLRTLRSAEFVTSARGLGQSEWRIVTRHLLPNTLRPVIVLATIGIGSATVATAGLSFIGLGASPPDPEWGSMLSVAQGYLDRSLVYSFAPGAVITLLVLSCGALGRAAERRLGL